MRADLDIVAGLVGRDQNVLDLGCGDGALLETLIRDQSCRGVGVERDLDDFHACIARGVPVTHGDLEQELERTADGSFDCAVLSLTLQAVRHPDRVLEQMGRVASRQIVSLPNFGHWRLRSSLALTGHMPISPTLPYDWYDTPNIHLCTIADFEDLVTRAGMKVARRVLVSESGLHAGRFTALRPNLLAVGAIYLLND